MGLIKSIGLQKVFIDWMNDCHDSTEGQVFAVYCKIVRDSYGNPPRQSGIGIAERLIRCF